MRMPLLTALVVLAGCGAPAPLTAASACARLESEGIAVAGSCRRETPGGANARARERYDFHLASLPEEQGSALTFASVDDYRATVQTYADVAMIAGSHRYGNERALVFVQLNHSASFEVGDRTRAIVDAF